MTRHCECGAVASHTFLDNRRTESDPRWAVPAVKMSFHCDECAYELVFEIQSDLQESDQLILLDTIEETDDERHARWAMANLLKPEEATS